VVRPIGVLTRRTLLRTLPLSALAVTGASALTACGSDPGSPGAASDRKGPVELVAAHEERAGGVAEAIPDAVAAMHALGAGLYGELAAKPGNLALSPYSVAVALAMTRNGARGRTLAEMTEVLGGVEPDRLNGGLNALTWYVESLAGAREKLDGEQAEIALRAANQLFGERTMTFEEPFLDVLAREYGAGLRTVDFRGDPEAARVAINDWTADRTEDRIQDLVPPGVLNTLTRLVLVNALYLKAPWEQPFEEQLTSDGDFHLLDGSTVEVPMMVRQLEVGGLGSGDGWRALQLPYAGRELAMTVVLPDEGRFAEVEGRLAELPAVLDAVRPTPVAVTLPRWTFRTQAPLKAALSALGMPTAFQDGRADFSGVTEEAELFLSAVLHQAFIAVDEEGTEAAAATAVVMQDESAPLLEPFVADRPFLFVIHDVEHGTPLFLGRVVDPRG